MRQLIILALVVLAASAQSAWNCSAITAPAVNFYAPSSGCSNDTAIAACQTAFASCSTANVAGTCANYMTTCTTAYLRCMEAAAPTDAGCQAHNAAFSNEKLYLAAGGDYSGSALEASCKAVVCAGIAMLGDKCAAADYNTICVDAISTAAPGLSTPAPRPNIGQAIASFRITGDKAKFQELINRDYGKAVDLIKTILVKILSTATRIVNENEIFVTALTVSSLNVEFYTTSSDLQDTTALTQALSQGFASAPADTFTALASEAGVDLSTIGLEAGSISVVEETAAPAPLTDSASAVAVAAAIAAVVLALLF